VRLGGSIKECVLNLDNDMDMAAPDSMVALQFRATCHRLWDYWPPGGWRAAFTIGKFSRKWGWATGI
jgi:hypothetical protein